MSTTSPDMSRSRSETSHDVIDLGEMRRERALDAVLATAAQLTDEIVIDLTDPERALESAAELFEADHYVERAPLFLEQIEDVSRTMPIRFNKSQNTYGVIAEHDGLVQLNTVLEDFLSATATDGFRAGSFTEQATKNLRDEATSIRENLTFIGDSEYRRATEGLALRWKNFLDKDPNNQLCVIAGVSSLERYNLKEDERKSDAWVLEDVLSHFTEEELEKTYKGRILTDTERITADEEHAKIILIDDWSISGRQLRDCYSELANYADIHNLIEAGCVEINLLAAGSNLIDDGLETRNGPLEQTRIPVYAYFRAKGKSYVPDTGNLHITGSHSSVNYGFRDSISNMLKILQMVESGGKKVDKRQVALLDVDPIYYDDRIPTTLTIVDGVVMGRRSVQKDAQEEATPQPTLRIVR